MGVTSTLPIFGYSTLGLLARADFDEDASLQLYGYSMSGVLAETGLYDAGLSLYGESISGLLANVDIDVDVSGQNYEVAATGDSISGLLACGIMFVDPVEGLNRAYWFESQAQVDGSISDCGLRDGAAESEWHA